MDIYSEPFFGPEHMAMPLCCVPGREAEAYAVVAEIDDWRYYPAEFLRLPAELINASQMRLLHWKATELLDPSRYDGSQPRRLMYKNVDIPLRYSHVPKVDDTTLDMRQATLISSMVEDGTHRPALDLDFPARLWRCGSSAFLWMDPRSPALDYHGFDMVFEADRAMSALGLHRVAQPPRRMADQSAVGHSAFSLGPLWAGSFEDLVAAAETVTRVSGYSDAPEGGVWYEVEGDALVVPSTSWFHFYSDHLVNPDDYRMAVHVAAACGILNPGFANGMEDRGFTSLRSPGLLKKPAPEPMDVDDIPF